MRFLSQRLFLSGFAAVLAGSCGHSSTDPNGGGLREIWYKAQAGYGRARPGLDGDVLLFGTGAGEVIARRASTGEPVWTAQVSQEPIKGANILVRSNVVVAPAVLQTIALDSKTGAVLWRYSAPPDTVGFSVANPGSVIDSRIDADADVAYIPAWGASVSAVDIHTGVPRWIWQPGVIEGDTATSGVFASGSNGVRLSGDTLFATLWHFTNRAGGTSEGWVVALNRLSGKELWRAKLPLSGSGVLLQSAPAIYKNLVIVNTLSAHTFAIDRETGQVVWESHAPNFALSTLAGPEVSGDLVYVDGGDRKFYALNAATGAIAWSGFFGNATTRDLLVTPRNLIFPTGGEIHVLDRLTGRQNFVVVQPHTSDPLFASAAQYLDGKVFVTVNGGAWCFEDP